MRKLIGFVFIAQLLLAALSHAAVESLEYDDVRYFLLEDGLTLERYDFVASEFLPSIFLPDSAAHLSVGQTHVFLAHDSDVFRYDLEEGARQLVVAAASSIDDLAVVGEFLLVLADGVVRVFNASSLDEIDEAPVYGNVDFVPWQAGHGVFYRTRNLTPADVVFLPLSVDGTLLAPVDSPYHGHYPDADFVRVMDELGLLVDSGGLAYQANSLVIAGTLSSRVDDVADSLDHIVMLRSDRLVRYSTAFVPTGEYSLVGGADYISIFEDQVLAFNASSNPIGVRVIDMADFSQPVLDKLTSDGQMMDLRRIALDQDSGVLYIADSRLRSVFRWSFDANDWLESVPLDAGPSAVVFSPDDRRLYIGYSSGRITYLDLNVDDPVEQYFAAVPVDIVSMHYANDYLVLGIRDARSASHMSLDASGNVVDTYGAPPDPIVLDISAQKIFYRIGSRLGWTSIDVESGAIGFGGESSFNDFVALGDVLRLNQEEGVLVSGSGYIFETAGGEFLGALGYSLVDAAWQGDVLWGLSQSGDTFTLRSFSSTYELQSQIELGEAAAMRLLSYGQDLLIVRSLSSVTRVESLENPSVSDRDGDSILDAMDVCPDHSDSSQSDMDMDGMGDVCDGDGDGDGIPNAVELEHDLDPLDSGDALDDKDGDSSSNLLEYLSNTDITSDESSPVRIGSLSESFEQANWRDAAWTDGLHVYGRWARSDDVAVDGSYSLKPWGHKAGDKAELNIRGYFETGYLTLSGYRGGVISNFPLMVLVDGDPVLFPLAVGQWNELEVLIPVGEHLITIVGSLSSPIYSMDIKQSVYLDSIGFRSVPDFDQDGVPDDLDNCIYTSNSSQIDANSNAIGDACETNGQLDSDQDGLSDELEGSYQAFDPLRADDLLEDYDGDGAFNVDELTIGSNPDVYEEFPEANLAGFFLYDNHVRLERFTNTVGFAQQFEMDVRVRSNGRIEIRLDRTYLAVYELLEDGIYLVEENIYSPDGNIKYKYLSGLPYLPFSVAPGLRRVDETPVEYWLNGRLVRTTVYRQELLLVGVGASMVLDDEADVATFHRFVYQDTGSGMELFFQSEDRFGFGVGLLLQDYTDSIEEFELLAIVESSGSGAQSSAGSLGDGYVWLLLFGLLLWRGACRHWLGAIPVQPLKARVKFAGSV